MTLLRKFLRKNPATAGRPGSKHPASLRPLSPGTEGPQAGQLMTLVHRRADKKRGNCPINETRAYRRVHSILAEGPNNG